MRGYGIVLSFFFFVFHPPCIERVGSVHLLELINFVFFGIPFFLELFFHLAEAVDSINLEHLYIGFPMMLRFLVAM